MLGYDQFQELRMLVVSLPTFVFVMLLAGGAEARSTSTYYPAQRKILVQYQPGT
jgi:hypothetical protein